FQAEDGIRDFHVTGVQTCALPIYPATDMGPLSSLQQRETVLGQLDAARKSGAKLLFGGEKIGDAGAFLSAGILTDIDPDGPLRRSEERRVGNERVTARGAGP